MAYQFTQTGAELQDLIDRIYQIAEEYDPGTSYVIGDYCSSGGKVYRCTAATTGTFEPSKWTDSVIVMDAVKSLKGRMDTAEGDIDALEALFSQSYSTKTGTTAYGSMTNRYVKIGKLIIGQIEVTPNQAITSSIGDFASMTPYPPSVATTCTVHSATTSEKKTQFIRLGTNGSFGAYGEYTANLLVSGVYCYMTA